jgi:CO/xanthine dehydrogenase FAD-binding subunit
MVELLKTLRDNKNTTIYAGGTDLMVTKRFKEHVVFINKIPELKEIEETKERLRLGACLTYSELIESDKIPEFMKKVFSQVASPAIRNRGTIGGNICNASPAGDTLPMWYALDASVVLKSMSEDDSIQERKILIRDFILGIRKIDKKENEVLVCIEVPKENIKPGTFFYYEKVGARRSEAISKLSFFGMAQVENGIVQKAEAAFGAVGVTVVNPRKEAKIFEGIPVDKLAEKKEEILEAYMQYVKPIDDQRSTAEYRKTVSRNLLEDFINQIA